MRLHVRATELVHRRLVLLVLSVLFALILFRVAHAQPTTDAVYRLPDSTARGTCVYSGSESSPALWEREQRPDTCVEDRPTDTPTTDRETAR